MCRPSAIARHCSQTPQGLIVGPPCPSGPTQLSAFATSRAVDVLPTPANSGEQKGVGDAAALDRVGERLDHRVLTDQLGEVLRPVLPREHAIRRSGGFLRHFRQVEAKARRFGFVHQRGLGVPCRVRAKGWRWEPERPETKSLWLLPSGSDQVGDSLVRPTPAAHMGEDLGTRKFAAYHAPSLTIHAACRMSRWPSRRLPACSFSP